MKTTSARAKSSWTLDRILRWILAPFVIWIVVPIVVFCLAALIYVLLHKACVIIHRMVKRVYSRKAF